MTIVVSCLNICPFQTLLSLKKSCNFNLLDLASELRLKGGMDLLDDDLLIDNLLIEGVTILLQQRRASIL